MQRTSLAQIFRPAKVSAAMLKRYFTAAHARVDPPHLRRRRAIARTYLRGSGLEIGGLHFPLKVPQHTRVHYVDRMSVSELRQQYPELANKRLVEVDVVDDGETLPSIGDESQDFVIANHLIEHAEDPILTISNWLRVLRPGGVIYMAVPDKEHTFDRGRPVTTLEHHIRDHADGPEWSRNAHFEEWVRLVRKIPEDRAEQEVLRLKQNRASIHYHVWTEATFLELLLYCRKELGFQFELELMQKNTMEFILVMRKVSGLPVL